MAKKNSNATNSKKTVKVAETSSIISKKVIAIIIGAIAIIALLLGLTCCNKDTKNDSKKDKNKVVEEKDKKEDEEKNIVPYYEEVVSIYPTQMVYESESKKEIKELKDTTAPVVTLNGEETMNIEFMYEDYVEQGATYTDDFDGSGTIEAPSKITKDGVKVDSVDKAVIGTYVLTYLVTDKAGNIGMATRTVYVKDTKGPKTNISVTVQRQTNSINRKTEVLFAHKLLMITDSILGL